MLASVLVLGGLILSRAALAGPLSPSGQPATTARSFFVRGVVKQLDADGETVVIRHEAVSGYMEAMTMGFKTSEKSRLKELRPGDEISFRLRVTETESWIDEIVRVGTAPLREEKAPASPPARPAPAVQPEHPLLDFKFTNELGQAVSLRDFRGQALAITFFFTRCPIPDYCPRLSKNFQEASQKLASLPGAPTNWHFLSVSFDPEFDTPPVLKAYGERFHSDPARWSFLTGPREQINELARLSGVEVNGEAGLFNHNFRTLVIDAAGGLQATYPFGGDLSDPIVTEMIKACAATNHSAARGPISGSTPAAPQIVSNQDVKPDRR